MQPYLQQFSLDFNFPVFFTRSVFSKDNTTFVTATRRLELNRRQRVLFIVDANLVTVHAGLTDRIREYFEAFPESLELVAPPILVAGGEDSKNHLDHVIDLLSAMNFHGMDRQSFVAIVGGGAVLDMAGFAAALAHRGIRAIRIPTTVLAQADSGVGVKNGINLFGKKNFIGTFVPPFAVINDSAFIETLEHRDKIAGIAEGVKVALLRDPQFFDFLERNANRLAGADAAALDTMIRQCAELHLRHIRESGDPFEFGSSRPLDFGHWSAHKLESLTDHQLRHGEAVAIGMALDVTYSVKKGLLQRPTAERILALLENLGLQLWSDAFAMLDDRATPAVLAGIREFREHLGGRLHITLLRDVGQPIEVHEMDETLILESIEILRARSQVSAAAE